jgi:hypothetical protein
VRRRVPDAPPLVARPRRAWCQPADPSGAAWRASLRGRLYVARERCDGAWVLDVFLPGGSASTRTPLPGQPFGPWAAREVIRDAFAVRAVRDDLVAAFSAAWFAERPRGPVVLPAESVVAWAATWAIGKRVGDL